MNYKLIAVDLDGTLVRSDQSISLRTIDTLIRAQQAGVKVVVASGRPTFGTTYAADILRLEELGGYVMSYNGGEIYDWQTKERLYAQTLNCEIIPYLSKCAKEHGMAIMTYAGKEVLSEDPNNQYVQFSSMRNRMPIRPTNNFVDAAQKANVVKCVIVGDPTPLQNLEFIMRKDLEGKAGVFRSEPFFLEIVPSGIDKAKGLEFLLKHIGARREELLSFGDGYNDIPMLHFAGTGVAMGNAHEEIKNAADRITLSNDDDGLAIEIEKLILNS